MKENFKIYIILGIIFLMVSVVAISFAFIGRGNAENNQFNVTGTVIDGQSGYVLSYEGNSTLVLNLSMDVLSSAGASNEYTSYAETPSSITVNLTTDLNTYPNGVTCEYSLYYTPKVVYTPSSEAKSNNLMELALVSTETGKEEKRISLDDLGAKTKVTTSLISTSASSATTLSPWNIALRFYNLDVDQESALGKTPSGTISFEVDKCYAN